MLCQDNFIVYTCVTDDYDKIKPVLPADTEENFVCFCDDAQQASEGWQHYPLQSPGRLYSGHDVNRYHKLFPHRLFPDTRYSIYVDGNVRFAGGYSNLIEALQEGMSALAAFSHPERRSVFQESEACEALGKLDDRDIARRKEQLRCYEAEGFDLSTIVTANYLLVRDHFHPLMDLAMSLWWSHLFEFTKRDQLSLNYALWKIGLPWVYLDQSSGVKNSELLRYRHKRWLRRKASDMWHKMSGHNTKSE